MGKLWTEKDEKKLKDLSAKKNEAKKIARQEAKRRREIREDIISLLRNDAKACEEFLAEIGMESLQPRELTKEEFYTLLDAHERDALEHLDAIRENDFWRMVDSKKREILARFGITEQRSVPNRPNGTGFGIDVRPS